MRYGDWDVILFPRNSRVPIQEFKTICYNFHDAEAHQLPTLTCYISSLPPSMPFRISVHSWASTAKPSAIIESQRKANHKVVYSIQVIVNGARIFRGYFDITSKWPQEIAHEQHNISSTEHVTSQRKPFLQFPPFLQHTLMQATWEAGDPKGRINVILSEQLICRNSGLAEPNGRHTNGIVCFSFQHAPKDILEQVGISWPIRNPLYLPNAHEGAYVSSVSTGRTSRTSTTQGSVPDVHMRSPQSHTSASTFPRRHNPELPQRPNSHPLPTSYSSRLPLGVKGGDRARVWDDTFGSYRDSHEDTSQDSWSYHRSTSNSTGDALMGDYMFASQPLQPHSMWMEPPTNHSHGGKSRWDEQQPKIEKERQVDRAPENKQFGMNLPHGSREHDIASRPRPSTFHAHYPPRMGGLTVTDRPSAATLANKSSYSDLTSTLRTASKNVSPDNPGAHDFHKHKPNPDFLPLTSGNKENFIPPQPGRPTPFPCSSQIPPPNPFNVRSSNWDLDSSTKDESPGFFGRSRYNGNRMPVSLEAHNKYDAHIAPSIGSVKSRKEGLVQHSQKSSGRDGSHSQGQDVKPKTTLRRSNTTTSSNSTPCRVPKNPSAIIDIIDVDALDSTFDNETPLDITRPSSSKPTHKSGMPSMDSTGRLEQHLFSALGEELSFVDAVGGESELTQSLPGTNVLEDFSASPLLNTTAGEYEMVGKRKRVSGEGDRSPVSKREKGRGMENEDQGVKAD
ncbi:hypothetical protein GQ44DRAFT_675703 [Phaeosphaeriaceae sp. PMI808]|nr:hypothetical protein GQ44DRAFT_675703 [Phaeosphaeriaceae sp. PMI808]